MERIKILVTGGGTSGHISPALAIIQTIREVAASRNLEPEFLYLGSKRGLEKGLVEAAGIPFAGVETGKLRRYFSLKNFTDALRVPVGLAQSVGQVKRYGPDVVVSTGGYVSVPPVIAARLLRVPVLIHEQTVQIGLANQITARCATRIALSFESAMTELAPVLRARAFVSGNPVRPSIFGGERSAAERWAGFIPADATLPTVYVTGGSQGARVINRAVEAALPELLQHCRIIHQCGRQPSGGEQDYDRLRCASALLPTELQTRYYATPFIKEEIKDVFALADLVVGRAGAGTVTELCALGKPAVYVPLVPTGGDEQTRNARMCVQAGAATVILQSEITGERLAGDVIPLLNDANRHMKMSEAAFTLARPEAARVLAEAVLDLAKRS